MGTREKPTKPSWHLENRESFVRASSHSVIRSHGTVITPENPAELIHIRPQKGRLRLSRRLCEARGPCGVDGVRASTHERARYAYPREGASPQTLQRTFEGLSRASFEPPNASHAPRQLAFRQERARAKTAHCAPLAERSRSRGGSGKAREQCPPWPPRRR